MCICVFEFEFEFVFEFVFVFWALPSRQSRAHNLLDYRILRQLEVEGEQYKLY
jgi:hypothetical protein